MNGKEQKRNRDWKKERERGRDRQRNRQTDRQTERDIFSCMKAFIQLCEG